MKITDITAYALSFPVSAGGEVSLGIGRTVKRDTVVVKVTTDEGIVGFGEAHHGRAPGAIAHLVNTTLRQLLLGRDALDVVGAWQTIYQMQLNSHGMGAATSMGLSGIDMALWDIRAKAAGWPLYRMLGGAARPIRAYAGGISLGFQPPADLVREAEDLVARGFRALKLRIGDSVERDSVRIQAVRQALGPDIDILADANAAYSYDDVRRIMPILDACSIGWLEEPFAPHDHRNYADAARLGRTSLAAGGESLHSLRVPSADRGRRNPDTSARSVEDGRHNRGATHCRDGVRLEAADQSAFLGHGHQYGRNGSLPLRH